jgi:PAS domain S-box-containing protein
LLFNNCYLRFTLILYKMKLETLVKPGDFSSFFNLLPGCHLVLLPDPPDFTITAATDDYLKAVYRKREEALGHGIFEINTDDPDNPEATGVRNLIASLMFVLQNKTEHLMAHQRYDIRNPATGKYEVRYWAPLNKPVLNSDGDVAYIIHSVEDLTENRRMKQVERLAHEKVVESERRLRNTILQAPVAICIFRGEQFVIEIANNHMFEFWGKSPEEVMSKPLFTALPEVKNQGYEELMLNVLRTGKQFSAVEQPVTFARNGEPETRYINLTYEPLREPDDSISGIMAMAVDVTEQVIARKKIEESEADLKRFKFMADHAEDPFILMRQDGSFAYLNKKALQVWGYTEEEAKNIRVPDVEPVFLDGTFEEVFQKAQSGAILHLETVHKRKNGETFHVEINMNGINLAGVPHLFAVARDITERKKAKEVLERSQAHTRLAMEAARLGTYETDLARQTITYSPRLAEIFGLDGSRQWPYSAFVDAVHPDDKMIRRRAHEEARQTGNLFYEARIVLPDESIRWIRLNGKFRMEDGIPVSVVGTVMDITEEKKAAELLEQKIDERTKELKQAIEQLREFTYAASHDLQEPLRKISFYLDRLLINIGPGLNPENKQITERIQYTTDRMRRLINDLLDYSNATQGVKVFQEINLNTLLKEALDDMEASIVLQGADIKVNQLPQVKGDARQLQQLFLNLFSNSLKYHKKGEPPKIQVSCKIVKGEEIEADLPLEKISASFYEIKVQDDGIGFSQEYTDRIFKLFQRLHGKAAYDGTGVGLAIAQKVIENHHGYITAESEQDKGAAFKVYLPVMENAVNSK